MTLKKGMKVKVCVGKDKGKTGEILEINRVRELAKVKEFTPSKGSVIFFQSTPNSYHGVSLFREIKGKKRFFIYGSYALSKPVVWRYKNVSYLPKIKKTNKRMLTSSHDSDYLMREVG